MQPSADAESSASGAGPQRTQMLSRVPRKLNFACESCRVKKRRCDGTKPRCRLCSALNTECVYKSTPTPKYVQDLEAYNSSLRHTLLRLKDASPAQRDHILSALDRAALGSAMPSALGTPSPATKSPHTDTASSAKSDPPSQAQSVSPEGDGVDTLAEKFKEQAKISVDGAGLLSLHGPSSLFYLAPTPFGGKRKEDEEEVEQLDIEQHLVLDWIDNMTTTASVPSVSNEVWQYLLKLHFTWVQPLFGFVHHKAFMRDMTRPRTSTSMFSPFLLYALCTHVMRYRDQELLFPKDGDTHADPFLPQARLLVHREIERGSSLSACLGLLLLSAKEVFLGRVGQTWVYLGIAVRMVQDLGIHQDGRQLNGTCQFRFSPDELRSRQHIFWSAYLWDKMVSLYLGRAPMLQVTKNSPPPMTGDPEIDHQLWEPCGSQMDNFPPYTPQPSYEVLTFAYATQLAVVMNDVLLYDAGDPSAKPLDATRAALAEWYNTLPKDLRYDPKKETGRVAPGHIVNLNTLYHMVAILVDRRQKVGVVQNSSVRSALDICVLAQISDKHYVDRQAVLSHCYCIYTAATVLLFKLKQHKENTWITDEEAIMATSLQWCLWRLSETSITIHALRIPIDVLQEHVSRLPANLQAIVRPAEKATDAAHTEEAQAETAAVMANLSSAGMVEGTDPFSGLTMSLDSMFGVMPASMVPTGDTNMPTPGSAAEGSTFSPDPDLMDWLGSGGGGSNGTWPGLAPGGGMDLAWFAGAQANKAE
ncbi:hypothetical protein Q8F55_002809 [Vanrija albida]|uniref:Zn(2)-C6 fungal-type domain-containing protein n=1 Tax=Vanrija albida TaxID=181172 RepID=A0ABR3QAU5_9TREE